MKCLLSSLVGCVLLCCEARAAMAQQPAMQWELQKHPIPHPRSFYSAKEGGRLCKAFSQALCWLPFAWYFPAAHRPRNRCGNEVSPR